MKAIDKIIFNELASRKAVTLPGLGTLGVTRRTAQVDGDQVKAPVNEVVFSTKEATDAPTVTALMESMGLDGDAARTAYGEWLDGVRTDNGFSIDGVGTMKEGRFTPSTELGQMLNPSRTHKTAKPAPVVSAASAAATPATAHRQTPPPADKSRRGNQITNILLAIAIALILALACFCVMCKSCTFCKDDGAARDADAVYNEARGGEELTPAEPEPAPEYVPSGDYHVIAGSFIYESNADELIARYRREFPDLRVEKLKTAAWVMVSVWQGATAEEGAAANRELRKKLDNPGVWVYRKR